VRSRQYLVEDVIPAARQVDSTLVRLSCLEDDAQGEPLEVLWEKEIDSRIIDGGGWQALAERGFASARAFSAYLHSLRWRSVTSTNPRLFQAPYRAGIEVKAYQLEPLRKALLIPRVNLFIADDVGLGKTIEAGLILRELLLRQKVRRTVICCPPSVVLQWQEEMEQRFGLSFVIYDRDYVTARRQERGFAINPWTTHSRFIISQALIRNESYAASLRDWLGSFCSGSILILDEAHNAAPSSGSSYAIDSKLTRTIRDLAPRFEHKLFLSATPHNGHSNSFSAMLEMLDPQRFLRGVPVHHMTRDLVMVRRLKHDLREIGEEFPERKIVRIELDDLPEDAPELQLSRLLQEYRRLREHRMRDATRSQQATAMLVVTSLQKRLLSSIEAFARTLKVHRSSLARQAEKAEAEATPEGLMLLMQAPGSDDERAALAEDEVQAEEDAQMAAASRAGSGPAASMAPELALLAEMAAVAERARYQRDAKVSHLIGWIKDNLVPDLGTRGAAWHDRRVLIFTEYTDTKRYLEEMLQTAIAGSDRDNERIMSFHGGIGEERRELIKTAFNADPKSHPLRILIATDAAREGVNLQNHCADLFHYDIPWNPGRMEQRNGRIDRKLQRAKEVRCHYYVLPQRAEDRVLEVLVAKTTRIHDELGSLSPVVERRIGSVLDGGISDEQERSLVSAIDAAGDEAISGSRHRVIEEELEEVRERRSQLTRQVERLEQMLKTSRDWIGLSDHHFRDALSVSLEMLGAGAVEPLDAAEAARDPATARWQIPALDERIGADPTWAATLDTLRKPRKRDQKEWEWRRQAPIRPVVFRDPGSLDGEVVHLHLEHRVVQRLLARFHSQGFISDQLCRACIARSDDPVPRVVVLGRLSLYGDGASRLHDEIIAVAAEWNDPEQRGRSTLRPLGEGDKAEVLHLLEGSLAQPHRQEAPETLQQRLMAAASRDIAELQPHLQRRAEAMAERAGRDLTRRGEQEARSMREILERQQEQIRRKQTQIEGKPQQLELFSQDEMRQLAADQRHWEARLAALEKELVEEPQRIRKGYEIRARRIEPVGLVYLWPRSS
jgi:SNF2 family DNA or RNA helicase